MINQEKGIISPKEALNVLVSYSVAQEGTNTLYIKLVSIMLQRTEPYTMTEIEMVLNYFPHIIWKSDTDLSALSDRFYLPMTAQVKNQADSVDTRQFLGLFQGLTLSGEQVFRLDLLNVFLNSYIKRL